MSEATTTSTAPLQRTSKFFDGYAADFDAIYGTRNTLPNRLINKYLRSSMRLRFEKTLAGCDPTEGRTVIDIGCGPGHYAIALARAGAARVLLLDLAEGMIERARRHVEAAGVADRCDFAFGDFLAYEAPEPFDYSILMGFMDYMADPQKVVQQALAVTRRKAFFSFPAAGGFLAWQRKLRYRKRCDLYLYDRAGIAALFEQTAAGNVAIEKIARDYFVTVTVGETGAT